MTANERQRRRRERLRLQRPAKPKQQEQHEPTEAQMDMICGDVSRWRRHPWCRPAWADEVLAALDTTSEATTAATFPEVCRRYLRLSAEAKAKRQAEREEAKRKAEREALAKRAAEWDAEQAVQHYSSCYICGQPPSDERRIVERGFRRICEHCARQSVAAFGIERRVERCSFCGKTKREVRKLVQGLDGVCICDECNVKASKVIAESIAS
jgi:hypothetical protein